MDIDFKSKKAGDRMKWKFKGKGNKKTGEFYRYGSFSNIKRRVTHGKGGYKTYKKVKKK